MNATEIYDILRAGGLTRAGALGMLGNMMAESSMIPNIAQRGMTKLRDEQYTAAADEGTIDFIRDAVGYGLCQWTYWSRKQALLNYAKEMHCSVGDGVMQTYFCLKELREDYAGVYKTLCSSDDIDACTDLICGQFERPAINNFTVRRGYAHTFEADIPDRPSDTPSVKPEAVENINASILGLQSILLANFYQVHKLGVYDLDTSKQLHEFVDDLDKIWGVK
jgi:hypothetical protein